MVLFRDLIIQTKRKCWQKSRDINKFGHGLKTDRFLVVPSLNPRNFMCHGFFPRCTKDQPVGNCREEYQVQPTRWFLGTGSGNSIVGVKRVHMSTFSATKYAERMPTRMISWFVPLTELII